MMPKKIRDMLWLGLRLLFGFAVLGVLTWYGRIDLQVLTGALSEPALLAGACVLIICTVPIATFRWWLLLRGLNFKVTLGWAFNTTLISLFCNIFLPGAYGGDIVRVALTRSATAGSWGRITFTILLDRLSGLAGLAAIGLAVIPGLHIALFSPAYLVSLFVLAALAFGIVIFGLLLGDRAFQFLSRSSLPIVTKISGILREIMVALKAYVGQKLLLLTVFGLSVAIFSGLMAALVLLGWAMHFRALGTAGYFAAGVWAMLANALPLTPGGLGIGEFAFARICHLLEPNHSSTSYGTVFLAMRVLNILVSLPGVFLWAPRRRLI